MTTQTTEAPLVRFRSQTREECTAIVQEIQRQKAIKRDVVAHSRDIEMLESGSGLTIDMGGLAGRVQYGIGPHAHKQLGEKLDIPPAYYRRMQAEIGTGLLAENVNHWLGEARKPYLIRTLDGNARAVLSDRYRVLDNIDLFYTAADIGADLGAEFHELELTETRFFMRMIHPEWRERIEYVRDSGQIRTFGPGDDAGEDWVIPGVSIQNSEVGEGGTAVEFYIRRLSCLNGMITDQKISRVHLGRKLELGFLSEETRALEDSLVWSQIRDVIRGAFDRDLFRAYVARINEAATLELASPVEAVDAVVKANDLTDELRQRILNELASPSRGMDPGRTVWGLVNAVTAAGREAPNAEAQVALERLGGSLLENAAALVEIRR